MPIVPLPFRGDEEDDEDEDDDDDDDELVSHMRRHDEWFNKCE
jgi:chromatin segregation and condensation protein Rec8/ScpA/Scc1 (kleisin family)